MTGGDCRTLATGGGKWFPDGAHRPSLPPWYAPSVMSRQQPLLGLRRSKSADEARRAQIARELAMSPLDRALLALALGRRDRLYAELAKRPR